MEGVGSPLVVLGVTVKLDEFRKLVDLYILLRQAQIGGRRFSQDEATAMGYLDSILSPLAVFWR